MDMVYDPRIPDPEHCVLPHQLERWARERPQQTAIILHSGERWTWEETLHITRRAAAGLRALGVNKGDGVEFFNIENSR